MVRLTLPLFMFLSEVVSAPLLQNSTKPQFFELVLFVRSQGALMILWFVMIYILSLI